MDFGDLMKNMADQVKEKQQQEQEQKKSPPQPAKSSQEQLMAPGLSDDDEDDEPDWLRDAHDDALARGESSASPTGETGTRAKSQRGTTRVERIDDAIRE